MEHESHSAEQTTTQTSAVLPNSSISIEISDSQMSSTSTTGNMVQLINIQADGTPISSKSFVITPGGNVEIKDYRAVKEC